MSQIGNAQHAKALALAHMNTTALNSAMIAVAKAKDEFTGAPVKLMVAMLSELGDETIDSLPRVGSKPNETDNPDIFPWKDPSKEGKEKDVSFYVVWSDNTPIGIETVTELGYLSCLNDIEKKRDHIPAEFVEKYGRNPELRASRKKYLEGRRGTIRASYKKAIQLMHQFDAVNELAGVEATTVPGDEPGTYSNQIKVKTKIEGRDEYEYYTVGSFLKLNAAKAAEQGGTLAALQATVARDTKKKGSTTVAAGIPALNSIKTPETLDTVLTAVHSYVDGVFQDKKSDGYQALLKFLVGPGGASAVETIGDLNRQLGELMKMDHIQFIYQKTKDAQHKAAA